MAVARALAILAVLCLNACASPPPAPTPTPAPPTPAPSPTTPTRPVPTLDPATLDVQDVFLANVADLTSEIEDLALAQCPDIKTETTDNPTEVAEIHGFAATLQRVGTSQAALQSDEVKASLQSLTQAINHLDNSLTACGLKTS